MTYRFKLQEPIGQGVRRIGLEQIEIAEAKLASKDDISAAIHDARRCLKRVRALLRLIQPGLEEDLYRREAERLVGHRQAAVRGARSRRDAPDREQAREPVRRHAGRRGRAAGQARGARPGPQPPRRRGWAAASAAAPRPIEKALRRQGHRTDRARPSHRWVGPHLPQGAQGVSTGVSGARATSPSTPGASGCSCTGATWRCSRGAGPRRCPRAPARPRSSRGCWGRITTTRSSLPWRGSAGPSILEPKDLEALTALCRSCQSRAADRGQAARREAVRRAREQPRGACGPLLDVGPVPGRPGAGQGAGRGQAGAERKGQERALSEALSESCARERSASAHPSIANPAANPNDAMNHGCHRLKLVPPSRAQVAKVA